MGHQGEGEGAGEGEEGGEGIIIIICHMPL